jgi:hypothetical protein
MTSPLFLPEDHERIVHSKEIGATFTAAPISFLTAYPHPIRNSKFRNRISKIENPYAFSSAGASAAAAAFRAASISALLSASGATHTFTSVARSSASFT